MITSVTSGIAATPPTPSPLQQASRDLVSSLRSNDLAGARQAYADVIRNRQDGSTWKPDSDFAALGKALVQGDVAAAKSIAIDAIKGKIDQPPGTKPPEPVPAETPGSVPSSTGGASGTVLNVVA